MTGKFVRRTMRTVFLPDRPYFAHLAITHRCNLKCRFCHVTETRFAELDTGGMKRAIDVLDGMGIAVISISGGGEPLLRDDFDLIINHATSRGLYVKLTSNGTMPRVKYERLLSSGVDEIGISMDGVCGSDLPFSHVGPPILSSLQYLNDNLPRGKKLTINVTVSESNRSEVQEILDYCAERYPRARVWLNPVIVGDGALRTLRAAKAKPDYLRSSRSPNLLSAKFYAAAADEHYRSNKFDWGCLAGDQFFDVKPNGDFWLCQDQPSPAPLNVLEPNFDRKRRCLKKGVRRDCAGCVYSCYYVVQKGFLPRNWRDVGLLWWQANTEPGSAQRQIADRFGWIAGLASHLFPSLAERALTLILFFVLLSLPFSGRMAGAPAGDTAAAVILERMEARGRLQEVALEGRSELRTYRAGNSRLGIWATVRVRFDHGVGGRKAFSVLQEQGSNIIVNRVILPLLAAEVEGGGQGTRTAIHRRNYQFRLTGLDAKAESYVFEARPVSPGRLQFRGHVWVDGRTFAIRRVEGEPAHSPSFWVKRTKFTREYRENRGYWFPTRLHSEAELRIFGISTLDILYEEYEGSGATSAADAETVQSVP